MNTEPTQTAMTPGPRLAAASDAVQNVIDDYVGVRLDWFAVFCVLTEAHAADLKDS